MSATQPTIYRVRQSWRSWALVCLGVGSVGGSIGLIGLVIFVPAGGLVSHRETDDSRLFWPFLALCVGMMCVALVQYGWRLLHMTLAVSSKGLEYRGMGTPVHIKWRQVTGYGPVAWGSLRKVEGLLIRDPVITGIPLDLFVADWPLSDLGVAIQQNTQPPAKPAPPPPPRRRYHRAPQSRVQAGSSARPAITQRLRPLRPSGNAVPGEWAGIVTERLAEHDGDTVRF